MATLFPAGSVLHPGFDIYVRTASQYVGAAQAKYQSAASLGKCAYKNMCDESGWTNAASAPQVRWTAASATS